LGIPISASAPPAVKCILKNPDNLFRPAGELRGIMQRIAVVTGGNGGLGREITRQLALQGIFVVLTARNAAKGLEAAQVLASEQLPVHFYQLDVTDPASVEALGLFLEKEFGRCDILVNGAGIFPDIMQDGVPDHDRGDIHKVLHAPLENIRSAMETNTYGPLLVSQRLVPLMQKDHYGRIVNISSGLGQLGDYEGTGEFAGYRISKTALNMVTRMLAAELKATNILVNSVCPGWCKTDMGGPYAQRSAKEGAEGVVYLATLPDGGPTGGFFRDRKPISW